MSKTKLESPLRRGFKADAEKWADEFRQILGLKSYSPLPATDLASHLGIRILIPSDVPGMTADITNELIEGDGKDRWSAAIYLKGEKKYIIHNPTHSVYRQESNLMHELAHAICRHELGDLEGAIMGCLVPLRKYDVTQEAEAECLGACLQLPQKALVHYHHILKKTPEEISVTFNASMKMVKFRMAITAVTRIKPRYSV